MAKTGQYIIPERAFHPGETLEEKLAEMGMTNVDFAHKTGLDIEYVNGITSCVIDITPCVATILEQGTNIPADFWLNKQHYYNHYRMEQIAKSLVRDLKSDPQAKKQKIKASTEKLYQYAISL